jgi:putative salt-induced outer membrane protein YdiY
MNRTINFFAFALLLNASFTFATEVVLSNGDTLNGEVLDNKEGVITFKHPALGTLVLANATITPVKTKEPKHADSGILNTGFLQNWKRSVEVGVNGSEGNTRNMHVHAGTQLKYENDNKRWNIESAYNNTEDSGETSRSDFFAKFSRDFLTPGESRFYFTEGRYDWDEFEDWDYRINLGAGLGEQLIKEDNWSVLGRLGLGFSKEFGGEDSEWVPEGLIGIESDWKIANRNTLVFKNTLYPSFREAGEFRNISELSWKIGLDELNGIDLKLGLQNEFDSNASSDSRKNDFKYNLSFVFGI